MTNRPSSPRQLNRHTGIIIYHLPTRCGVHSRVIRELEALRHRNFFPFSFRFCFNTRDFARQRQSLAQGEGRAALLMEQENKGGLKIKLRLGGELIPREEPQPLQEHSKVFIPLEALQACNRHRCYTSINCFSSALPCVGRSGATQGDNQAEAPP